MGVRSSAPSTETCDECGVDFSPAVRGLRKSPSHVSRCDECLKKFLKDGFTNGFKVYDAEPMAAWMEFCSRASERAREWFMTGRHGNGQ